MISSVAASKEYLEQKTISLHCVWREDKGNIDLS